MAKPPDLRRLAIRLERTLEEAWAALVRPEAPLLDAARDVAEIATTVARAANRPQPVRLYRAEGSWDYWIGSPGLISLFAERADDMIGRSFATVAGVHTFLNISVAVPGLRAFGVGSASALQNEIQGRRAQISAVLIQAQAYDARTTPFIFEELPSSVAKAVTPPPSYSFAPPVRISIQIAGQAHGDMRLIRKMRRRPAPGGQPPEPAVQLIVHAPHPEQARRVFEDMADHIKTGRRPHVWRPTAIAYLACVFAIAVPCALFLAHALTRDTTLGLQAGLGPIGWLLGFVSARW